MGYKRNRMSRSFQALSLLGSLMSMCAYAQIPKTCGDLEWAPAMNKGAPINSPNAGAPKTGDGLAAKQKSAYLVCDIKPLMNLTLGKAAQTDTFKLAVSKALSQDKSSAPRVAKAVYLRDVFPSNSGAQGYNTPSATWRRYQAEQWCEKSVKEQDSSIVNIPNNLPSLGEAVRNLDARAIDFSWQVLSKLDANGLKGGCNAAIKRFVDSSKN
jgi:hypothetical protein